MAHRRSRIFGAIKAALQEIPEFSAAGKVERGRTKAIAEAKLPALTLTWAERGETAELRPGTGPNGEDCYVRQLPISLVMHLRDADPEEEFDHLCTLIEAKMAEQITLDGEIIEMLLDRSDFYVDPRTGLPLGAGRLVYMVSYVTVAANPAVAGR